MMSRIEAKWYNDNIQVYNIEYDTDNNKITMDCYVDNVKVGKYIVFYSENWNGNVVSVEANDVQYLKD